MFSRLCLKFSNSCELFATAWPKWAHRYLVYLPAISKSEPMGTFPHALDNISYPHAIRYDAHSFPVELEFQQEHLAQIFDFAIFRTLSQFMHLLRCSFQTNRKDLRPLMVYYKILYIIKWVN